VHLQRKLSSVSGELAVTGNDNLKVLSLPSLVNVTFEVYLMGEDFHEYVPLSSLSKTLASF
jgi:hypothetical protein